MEEFKAQLLQEVAELRKEVQTLRKEVDTLKSSKSTPRKKTVKMEPKAFEEYIGIMKSQSKTELPLCSHYYKTGNNKGKICSAPSGYFKGEVCTEVKEETSQDYKMWHFFKCSKHKNGTTNSSIDNTKKMLENHFGNAQDDTVVRKDEDTPSEQVASLLGGGAVNVVTTPSKAKASEPDDSRYIEAGDFLHKMLEVDSQIVVIKYSKKKDGTPSRRSPRVLGIRSAEATDENYMDSLEKPSDTILARVNFKYEPPEKEEEEEIILDSKAVQPSVPMPETKTDEEIYNADTEIDEDVDDLMNALSE